MGKEIKEVLEQEKEIERLKEALARQEEKCAGLEKKLEKANLKMAEAEESKSRFLAHTSHEIRTPLNIIVGMTELAKADIDNQEKVKDYLQKINQNSRILMELISDILDISAIEDGRLEIVEEKYDFKAQLTNLSIVQYENAVTRDIHFDMHLSGVTEEFLTGDEARVNQILDNILSNALKFTPAGGSVNLEIIQASRSSDRVHMRFIVEDTGCGMSEDMLRRVYNVFEHENDESFRKYGGSGLGLAITKRLVDLLGGNIRIDSKLGEGTTVVVDIPFTRCEKGEKEKVISSFAKYRAIVIAETEEYCIQRGSLLEDVGLSYDIATDADTALDMIGEAEENEMPYKICIIDWRVSTISGIELIKEIRDIFGDEMVIIGAAFEFSDSLAKGREAGANYMVAKPVFRSTLFDALMNISKGKIDQYDRELSEPLDFSGKKVLLAEDVALNMEVAVKLLKRVGVQSICAENGLEAVEIFKRQEPGYFDCIFLDINMPVMDGYEAARQIRSCGREDAEAVPIYAMTANVFTSDISEALDAGMNGHIAKPIETDVLYHTLKELFEKH